MSLFDSIRKEKKSSAQRLIGTEHITQNSIRTAGGRHIVYFLVQPVNLAVLSRSSIQAKVDAMMNTLKALPEVEMLCLGSREDFEGNKLSLKNRLEVEENEAVRRVVGADYAESRLRVNAKARALRRSSSPRAIAPLDCARKRGRVHTDENPAKRFEEERTNTGASEASPQV